MSRGLSATVIICVAAAGIVVGALVFNASDGGDDEPSAPGQAASGGNGVATVVIDDFAFSATTVAPGGTVTVDNRDEVPHTATATDGSFDTGSVEAGAAGSFTAPSTPGDHQIQCTFHPQMSGTLTVAATGDGAGEPGGEVEVPTPPVQDGNGGNGGY